MGDNSLIDDFFNPNVEDADLVGRIEDPRAFLLELRKYLRRVMTLATEEGRQFFVLRLIERASLNTPRRLSFSQLLEAMKFLSKNQKTRVDRLIDISPMDLDRMLPASEGTEVDRSLPEKGD